MRNESARIRLLFVVESGTDVRMVEGLAERTDLTVLGRTIPGGRIVSREPEVSVPAIIGPSSRIRFAVAVFFHLFKRRKDFDAVLVQGYGLAALAANCASRVLGPRSFMLVCSPIELYYACRRKTNHPDMPYRPLQLWALKLAAAANARIGTHYVVLSRHLGEVVENHGTRRPVNVIPIYGVDTNRFKPTSKTKLELRQELGLPESGVLVFFSSRVAPEKDAESLLEAAAQLTRAGREIRLLNLSGGHEAFRAAADKLNLADRVIAKDAVHPVHELPAFYQASDLCVQASVEEGLGFSPLEALACEVPVVAAAVGGLKETVIDGETGWTYRTGNAAELADRIAVILDNTAEAERRAAKGRSMVIERYERSAVFEEFTELVTQSI